MRTSRPDVDALLQANLFYLKYKICAFPCRLDKRPIGAWKQWQTRRPTRQEIESLYRKHKDEIQGIGIITGPISGGLVIRDFDDAEEFYKWERENPVLAALLPIVKTFRGYHVFFRTEDPYLVFALQKGGEYRGDSCHFTVTVPSNHPKGIKYSWYANEPKTPNDIPKLREPNACGLIDLDFKVGEKHSKSKTKYRYTSHTQYYMQTERKYLDDSTYEKKGKVSAAFWVLSDEIECIARRQCPTQVGQRNRRIFLYVRDILGLKRNWTQSELNRIFDYWWGNAKYVVSTKCEDVSKMDFLVSYAKCRCPKESMDWERLLEGSDNIKIPKVLSNFKDRVAKLWKACVRLHQVSKEEDKRFYLSKEEAGKAVKASASFGQYGLGVFVQKGLLEIVESGSRWTRTANTYRITKGVDDEN